MEFLGGHFAPINSPLISSDSSSIVLDLFKTAGIDAVDSAVTYQDRIIQKVVDFKVLEHRT